MFVQQFFVKGLAHSSYLLGAATTCAIVDPQRDVQIYIDAADEVGMRITHILETHLHADFVSGHMDLAAKTGAVIYAPKAGRCVFKHVPVQDKSTIRIEDLFIKVLDTPGHTPEHVSYVVLDSSRGEQPVAVFCGDTLFVGDVGRPDLFPGKAQQLACKLYDSLHKKLLALPDFCEVYPAHGAGSLCGRAMGAKRTSTIGYERRYNPALRIRNKTQFVKSLTTNMPAAPDHFSRCSAINAKGPALLRKLPQLQPLSAPALRKLANKRSSVVLDTRSYEAFGGQHIPGAYHIDFGGNFVTFAGWVIPPDKNILLVTDSPEQAHDAVTWLRRVGLDCVIGYLDGGMFEWARAGFATDHIPQLSTEEFHDHVWKTRDLAVIDVRTPAESDTYHVKGAINMPTPTVRTRYRELNAKETVAVVCASGHRSSLCASLLKQRGFSKVYNVAGGMTGYIARYRK